MIPRAMGAKCSTRATLAVLGSARRRARREPSPADSAPAATTAGLKWRHPCPNRVRTDDVILPTGQFVSRVARKLARSRRRVTTLPYRLLAHWMRRLDVDRANALDVLFCYRLLLGRRPDESGWSVHSREVEHGAVEVAELVNLFTSSPEFFVNHPTTASAKTADHKLVQVEGFRIFASPTDRAGPGRALLREGRWEANIAEYIRQNLKPDGVFVDIGANIGYFTLLAASQTPDGKVLAFEPNRANCGMILASLKVNGLHNVEILPFALGDRRSLFALAVGDGSNGILMEVPAHWGADRLQNEEIVYADTLDRLLGPADRVDIIKIDVEGGEGKVIRGARETIRANRPVIISEFAPHDLQSVSGCSGAEYLEQLISLGYELSVFQPEQGKAPLKCGRNWAPVLDLYQQCERSGGHHIDLLAQPAERVIRTK